jgi:hypothetical protein
MQKGKRMGKTDREEGQRVKEDELKKTRRENGVSERGRERH